MKSIIITLITFLMSLSTFAQQGINYKAVLKDTNGNVLADTDMTVQFTIHETSATGMIVYQEDHNYTTDVNGMVILNIGTISSPSVGVFSDIDWSANQHFLQTSITYSGGTINFDATEFMAVPYAKHAETAGNLNWTKTGANIENNNSGIVTVNSNSANPLSVNSSSTSSYMIFNNSTGYKGYAGIYNGINDMNFGTGFGNSTGKTHLVTQAFPRITIDSEGKVGVDITSPTQRFEVNGKLKIGDDSNTPTIGTIRYNSSQSAFEGYASTGWETMAKREVKKIVIGAASFTPRVANNYINNGTRAFFTSGAGTSHSIFAPITIPAGARITRIAYLFYDIDGTNNLQIKFYKSCGNSIGSTLLHTHLATGSGDFVRNHQYSLIEDVQDDCQYFVSARAFTSGTSGQWTPDMYLVKIYVDYQE